MTLENEESGNGLNFVPQTYGMDVPSACTIVVIAGKNTFLTRTSLSLIKGKYLEKVDRVMTQVDRITEDIDHMPVAAFIFKDKESDEVHYSTAIR